MCGSFGIALGRSADRALPLPEVESDEVESDLAADIAQIVALPNNVIPFPRPKGHRLDED